MSGLFHFPFRIRFFLLVACSFPPSLLPSFPPSLFLSLPLSTSFSGSPILLPILLMDPLSFPWPLDGFLLYGPPFLCWKCFRFGRIVSLEWLRVGRQWLPRPKLRSTTADVVQDENKSSPSCLRREVDVVAPKTPPSLLFSPLVFSCLFFLRPPSALLLPSCSSSYSLDVAQVVLFSILRVTTYLRPSFPVKSTAASAVASDVASDVASAPLDCSTVKTVPTSFPPPPPPPPPPLPSFSNLL